MIAEPNLARLRAFVMALSHVVEHERDEDALLARGAGLLRDLVGTDDWLPEAFAAADPARYRQYLLHCDSRERFSIVSFVWGPGQATPIHDHKVWGLIGVLRGAELSQAWQREEDGGLSPAGAPQRLEAGAVECLSPRLGDIHRVINAFPDRVSISIHVYGGNIGRVQRASYQPDGTEKPFVSGYSSTVCPNLWAL